MSEPGLRNDERAKRSVDLAWYFQNFGRFCALLDIVPKDGRKRKFQLNQIQKIFTIERTGRDIVLKARQVGFSTLEQARDVYHFLTVRGAHVVTVCQSDSNGDAFRMLAENYRVMFEALDHLGLKLTFGSRKTGLWTLLDRNATLEIIVAGASSAAAMKKGRGGRISRLHCTENSVWEYATETMNALLECVPAQRLGSEIVIESTPHGASGLFYEQCKAAEKNENGYKLHFFPWYLQTLDGQVEYAVPLDADEKIEPANERERNLVAKGVTPEQLKWYRQKVSEKGQDLTDQEYPSDPETCFLFSGRGFFDQVITKKLVEAARAPIEFRERDTVRVWTKPSQGRAYLISADPSGGGGGDPSAGIVYDLYSGEHVATLHGQFQPWELARALTRLGKYYNTALVAVERSDHGVAVLQALIREQKYPRIYEHVDEKPGWPTNAVTRPMMLDELDDVHRRGLWTSNDRDLLAEMRTFITTDSGKAEAAPGKHDDLVIAAAIGWAIRLRPQPESDDTDDVNLPAR